MPKIVDHDAKKRELMAATWQLIQREGVTAATVRAIAQEAGITPGQLRYYFPDQQALLLAAAQHVGERLQQRINEIINSSLSPKRLAQQLLEELLPLDETRLNEGKAWLGCLEHSLWYPAFAEMQPHVWQGTRYICRLAVASLRKLPLPEDMAAALPDPHEAEASRLHTFMDGLTLQALTFPQQLTPQAAQNAVNDQLLLIGEREKS